MIKSMTGYGRSEIADSRRKVTAEIRSVNHRYCEISVHMPRKYAFAEEAVKNAVKKTVKRGKADVSLSIENVAGADVDIQLNQVLADMYYWKLKELSERYELDGGVSLEYLSSLPDVLKTVPAVEDEEEIIRTLVDAVSGAGEAHNEMRLSEGRNMSEDLRMRAELITGHIEAIENRSPEVRLEYYNRLKERMTELLQDAAVNEDRLLQEAAVFADKISVAEETVRLRSHISQMEQLLQTSTDPVGKKMDFLVQEMNREANTIGSKANDIEITRHVLDIKSEVEKIREQVQNIE